MYNHTNDLVDYESIPIQIKDDCMSCSGNKAITMSCFKLACLTYKSRKVEYNENSYDKNELLDIRRDKLNLIIDQLSKI